MNAVRDRVDAWWHALPQPVRSNAWPAALAGLAILALLLAFTQVVKSSVRQGELLRMTAATHAQAVWRCNALNGQRMRAECLEQLNAAPKQQAKAPQNTAASPLQVAHVGR